VSADALGIGRQPDGPRGEKAHLHVVGAQPGEDDLAADREVDVLGASRRFAANHDAAAGFTGHE
jgi:hypothetical protein